jgi:hypothetical protein
VYAPLTDNQWKRVGKDFPKLKPKRRRKADRSGGRPRLPDRTCFNAMLWTIFHGGADLPKELGTTRTLRARMAQWQRQGLLIWAWDAYLKTLPPERLREHSAALARHRGAFGWRCRFRHHLDGSHRDKMAAAALPPKTDKPADPELEALFDRFSPPWRK